VAVVGKPGALQGERFQCDRRARDEAADNERTTQPSAGEPSPPVHQRVGCTYSIFLQIGDSVRG
jgi:hypothetical protein